MCLGWGSIVWRGAEEELEKNRQRSTEGERATEKVMALQGQTKLESMWVVCCLFTVLCHLHRCSRALLSSFPDRRWGKDMWLRLRQRKRESAHIQQHKDNLDLAKGYSVQCKQHSSILKWSNYSIKHIIMIKLYRFLKDFLDRRKCILTVHRNTTVLGCIFISSPY